MRKVALSTALILTLLFGVCSASGAAMPPPADTVYVDANWTADSCGGHTWDFDATNSIQRAVELVNAGGTVIVYSGTYTEQVVINKNLSLQGDGGPVITAPATVAPFKFPESGATWEPVVVAFGGTADANGNVSGDGTVSVNVSGITVDGNQRAPTSGRRAVGIALRNVTGTVDHNVVRRMYIDGAETVGIYVGGASNVTVSYNDVSGWSRVGIGVLGDFGSNGAGPLPDPHATVSHNNVTGPGMGIPVTWAPNGIEFGYGATGQATDNTVTGCGYPGSDWSGTGIILVCAGIQVSNNTVTGNQIGVGICGWMWQDNGASAVGNLIQGNSLTANDYGISVQNKSVDTSIVGNRITGSRYNGIEVCNFGSEYSCYGPAPTGTVIHGNIIAGNNASGSADCAGLWVDAGVATVDATQNYWGDVSGAHHDGDSPTGSGDWIIGSADHDPWYLDEAVTILSNDIPLVTKALGGGSVTASPAGPYAYGHEVHLTAVPAPGWEFERWSGDATGSANPTTVVMDGPKTVTAVFGLIAPVPSGTTGEFTKGSSDGMVVVEVPAEVSEDPVTLTVAPAETVPPTGGNPNLGVYDVELKVAITGEAVHDLRHPVTISFHYSPSSLAAAGVSDPHQLRIWYWDVHATPPCWVALPTVVDEAAGTVSTTVDHLTTFTAMADPDFPALPDAAGNWAEAAILRLASLGAVSGFEDGTFRPDLAVTRAQFAKFIVKSLGIAEASSLPPGIKDAAAVPAWAVPFVGACVRDHILTGSDGFVRPNDTITRAEAAAMIVRALKLGLDAGGSLGFADAAAVPGWATAYVGEAVAHGLITGLPGNVFDPFGKLTRAQAVTILARALDLEE